MTAGDLVFALSVVVAAPNFWDGGGEALLGAEAALDGADAGAAVTDATATATEEGGAAATDATATAAEEGGTADTYVIGRTADVDPYRGVPGYQTFELNGRPYTWEANESWLRTALANGNPIRIVSELSPENMASSRFGISGFGRELRLLWNEGLSPDPFAELGQTLQTSPVAP